MKKNRYLPFGYHIQNGVLCIHNAESAVVQPDLFGLSKRTVLPVDC